MGENQPDNARSVVSQELRGSTPSGERLWCWFSGLPLAMRWRHPGRASTEEELAQTKLELSTLSLAHDTLQERNWLLYEENERLRPSLRMKPRTAWLPEKS